MANPESAPGKIKIIGGKWRGRLLPVVSDDSLRPTPARVRETVFNWLQADIAHARCLDLFAGTGALGIEALSRGAKEVVFVELKTPAFNALKTITQTLNVGEQCQVIQQDALVWIEHAKKTKQQFDIIFLDPPFASTLLKQSLSLLFDCELLAPKALLYIESALALQPEDLPTHWKILKQKKASDVHYQLVLSST